MNEYMVVHLSNTDLLKGVKDPNETQFDRVTAILQMCIHSSFGSGQVDSTNQVENEASTTNVHVDTVTGKMDNDELEAYEETYDSYSTADALVLIGFENVDEDETHEMDDLYAPDTIAETARCSASSSRLHNVHLCRASWVVE